MASPFKNSFFSVAGQKERVANVGNVLGIATGLYNPNKATIVSNTGVKPLDTALAAVANHPYVTAGVAAAGITAAGYTATTSGGLAAKAAGTSVLTGGTSLKTLGIVGGAGALIGSMLNSGGGASGTQNTDTTQNTNPSVFPKQKTEQNPPTNINPSQMGGNPFDIYGNNNRVNYSYRQSQDVYTNYTYNAMSAPEQPVSVSATPSLDVSPSQTTTAESGTNWLLIGAVAAGVYYLAKS